MTVTRKLTHLALASAFLVCILGALFHSGSELRALADISRLRIGTDSTRFMDRAWDTLLLGQPLYRTLFFEQHIKFIYPTSSLLTYSFATLLHLRPAMLLQGLAVLSLPVTLYFAGEIFLLALAGSPHDNPTQRIPIRLLIALLGLFFYPLAYSVQLGQVQAFLNLLWTLAIYLWILDRKVFAGICLAITCAFKPTLAVFLLWAALRREGRFLLSLAGTALLLQAVAIVRFGWHNEIDYLAVLSYISHRGEAFLPNQSVNGFLQRITRNGDITAWSDLVYPPYRRLIYFGTLLSSAAILGFGLFVPILRRRTTAKPDTTQDFILFGLLATLASPIVWDTHYGYFFPACIYFLALIFRGSFRVPYTFLICYLILSSPLSFLAPLAQTPFTFLLSPYLYAGLSFMWLLAFRPATWIPSPNGDFDPVSVDPAIPASAAAK